MKPLQIVGIVLGAAFDGLLMLFIGASVLSESGDPSALPLVLAWLVPPVILAVVAWLRPDIGYPILVGMVGLVLLAAAASIPWADQVWAFENSNGPIDLMVLLGALLPLLALGRGMPTRAGWLMLITIVGTIALHSIGLIIVGQASVIVVFVALMPPFVAAAILFIVAGRQTTAAVAPPAQQRVA